MCVESNIHDARKNVWRQQPDEFFNEGTIDLDGTEVLARDGCGMDAARERYKSLLCSAAQRLTDAEHRSFIAEVTEVLCDGSVRRAEGQFGWGRETIRKELHERRSGLRCVDNFAAHGRR